MSTTLDPVAIGEHIRKLRTDRGYSLRSFAARTGFSPSFISQLENGQVLPSLGSLHKIAEALGVTLGGFFHLAETTEDPLILRSEARPRLDSTWTDAHLEALSLSADRDLEAVMAIFGPGGKSGKHAHAQVREEFAYVVRGQVTLTLADEESTLVAGDAVALPAGAPRRWENRSQETAEILMVSTRAGARP